MPNLDKAQLEKALDKIFEFMHEKGIKLDKDKRDEIKEKIASELQNTLSPHDIQDVNVQKKLMSCITSLIMGKDLEYKATIATLKSDKKNEPDETLDAKLTAQLMLLVMMRHALVLDPSLKLKTLKPDEFKQKMLDNAKEEKIENPKIDLLKNQIDNCLRNLFGGDNPTFSGGVPFPLVGPVFGDLSATTTQIAADPTKLTLKAESITFNTNRQDYMGLENITKIQEMTEGIDVGAALSPTPKYGKS